MESTVPIPEITPIDLQLKLKANHPVILLDVREPWEVARVCLKDERLVNIPLSQISAKGVSVFPEAFFSGNIELIVICHRGVRSAQVTAWLSDMGRTHVYSLAGGLHAYANQVDPTIGFY
jgi:rhodanese-related sulfurtransferase